MEKRKGLIGFLIALLIGIGGTASFGAVINKATYTVANVSTSVEIGPDEDNRVIATTSRRSYLQIQSTGSGNVPVYCEANRDIAAVASEGIVLSSTTSMTYEFRADKGNLYVGSLRCTATASTTLLVTEFAD